MSESASGEANEFTVVKDKDISVCPTCGRDDFSSRKGLLVHHGRMHGSNIRVAVACEYCNEKTYVKPSHVDRTRFCSKHCKSQWESNYRVGVNNSQFQDVEKECEWCSAKYTVAPYREDNTRFCSRSCKAKYEYSQGRDGMDYNHRVSLQCEYCSKTYEVKRYQKDISRFCSNNCKNKWQSENLVGENNPNWRGGYGTYYGENWYRVRKRVLKRDNHKCQSCGGDESDVWKLDVHHISPLRTFDNPHEANTLLNLVTLCASCHKKWEGIPLRPDTR